MKGTDYFPPLSERDMGALVERQHIVAAIKSMEDPRGSIPSGRWVNGYNQALYEVVNMISRLAAAQQPPKEVTSMEFHGHDTATAIHFYEPDFYCLSNFSAFRLQWNGIDFQTSEHAYQWAKFDGSSQRAIKLRSDIIYSRSAHEAFKLAEANKHHRRIGWEALRVPVMYEILTAKEKQHEYVSRKLMASGTKILIEDSWRDSFWGWGPNREGKNMLGRLWMYRRQVKHGSPRRIDWDNLIALAAE